MLRQSLFALTSLSCALLACQPDNNTTTTTGGSAGTTTPSGGGGSGAVAGGGTAGSTTTSSVTESIDKAKDCVDSQDDLGVGLTNAFGRLDGTVLAVVKPTDTACFLPNDDHVVLQVLWNNEAYRMVINVQSSFGDPDVFYLVTNKVPTGAPWVEGWHPGVTLDYVNDLGIHANEFTQFPMLELSDKIADEITLGQKVSVYAESDNYPSSAHNIHRNGGGQDGAIVIDPESDAPRALLFHFADQNF
ncbi:MAG: hypothetical protein IPK82_27820 [Polyangiaceae bacterium]|nr:hypothetical protein [Polyangiaceae bacterium]